jgi:glycosyltransferase involved in cell wall biosynthesis
MAAVVSILIPCHNAGPWLAAALDSACGQTWPHREIIVVDDGSTDDSAPIARRYASSGVKLISQPRRGASAARNTALAVASGDFIQYLDADDLLAPDKVALQIVQAMETQANFAFCATWSRFTRSVADADFSPQPLCGDFDSIDWLVLKLEQNRMMHPAAWLIPRAISDVAGPWNETLSLDDDGEYFTRVVLPSKGVRCCRDAISYYRSGLPRSLSDSQSEEAWKSAWRARELSIQHLLAAEDSPRTRHAAATALQRFIYESYPRVPQHRAEAALKIRHLGGSSLAPEGGPLFQTARRIIGWRLAKRLQLRRRS